MFIKHWNSRFGRVFFNADAGGGTGGDGGSGGSGGTGGDGGSDGGSKGSGGSGGDGGKVTFTDEQQAEIDRIVAGRVKRAQTAAQKQALADKAKELGFESAEEMEKALAAHKERQEKEKSELDKEREAKQAAEQKAKDADARARTAFIKAAFAEQAIAQNLVSVDDAFKLADLSEVEVKDDGTVEGVKEAVEALVKEKPYLVKQAVGSGGSGGGNPPRGNQQTDDPAERGRQAAQRRNQQQTPTAAGFDPWATQGGAGGGFDVNGLAQAVAAAVAAAIQGQGNK